MEITYLGLSSFKIKGKNAVLVTDPYSSKKTGLKFPNIEANVITISHSHEGHNNINAVSGDPIVFAGPGEYESKGIKVIGIRTYHDQTKGETLGNNTLYKIDIDGVSIVHLGDLGHKLSEKEIEMIDKVDILLIPVGGTFTINAQSASEIITSLEPKVVIPMHYKIASLNNDPYGKLADINDFLKEIGKEQVVPQQKYSVTKDKLPAEMTVIVLQ
jgi:L-ascorbate metabolism protein UlaG (beta-lactamase superfamily)